MSGYVTVVGGANVDIGGFSRAPLVDRDSNPGRVSLSLGGVGRNVAHNLCLMGQHVKLISVMGQDANGSMICEGCEAVGMDLSLSRAIRGRRTSTYLYVADSDGDMRLAIADMDIYDAITPDFLARRMDAINAGRAVVVDANLPEESILYLARHAKVPVVADPVSGAKAARLIPALPHLAAIKPNALEAGILTGEDTSSFEGICRAAERLVELGAGRVLITMGEQGVCCADEAGQMVLPSLSVAVRNATGAGDAFTAGLCVGMLRGWDLKRVGRLAQAASVIAIASEYTVNPDMSLQRLLETAGEIP
ncbi:MAG: carbohydrate kinase family protein [Clostridia bacterium]|nr:carbohydrate kinase family protein [Clostridia bacterium]